MQCHRQDPRWGPVLNRYASLPVKSLLLLIRVPQRQLIGGFDPCDGHGLGLNRSHDGVHDAGKRNGPELCEFLLASSRVAAAS